MSAIKRDFMSGIIVFVPVLIVLIVADRLYAAWLALPFVPNVQSWNLPVWIGPLILTLLQFVVAITVFVLIIYPIGYLMRTTFGNILERAVDYIIMSVPVPRLQATYATQKFRLEQRFWDNVDVVIVEPCEGMEMIAFRMYTGHAGISDGTQTETVFVPNTPKITTGILIEVDTAHIREADMDFKDAKRKIIPYLSRRVSY